MTWKVHMNQTAVEMGKEGSLLLGKFSLLLGFTKSIPVLLEHMEKEWCKCAIGECFRLTIYKFYSIFNSKESRS